METERLSFDRGKRTRPEKGVLRSRTPFDQRRPITVAKGLPITGQPYQRAEVAMGCPDKCVAPCVLGRSSLRGDPANNELIQRKMEKKSLENVRKEGARNLPFGTCSL